MQFNESRVLLRIYGCLCDLVSNSSYGPCSVDTTDDGWINGGDGLEDYCYMIIDQARSWQYANDHCIHHGGHLASVHSKAENDRIQGDYWIGLIKIQPGGQHHWSDNTSPDFTNWGDGGMKYHNYKPEYTFIFKLWLHIHVVNIQFSCIFRTE